MMYFLIEKENMLLNYLIIKEKYLNSYKFERLNIPNYTFNNLDIFNKTIHPSQNKGNQNNIKEGFSLFNLFYNNLNNPRSRKYLKNLMKIPVANKEIIFKRNMIIDFIESINVNSRDSICKLIKNYKSLISRNFKSIFNISDLLFYKNIYINIKYVKEIFNKILNYSTKKNSLEYLFYQFIDNEYIDKLYQICLNLDKIANFNANEVLLKKGVNDDYDNFNEAYGKLNDYLQNLELIEIENLKNLNLKFENILFTFIKNVGYIICIEDLNIINEFNHYENNLNFSLNNKDSSNIDIKNKNTNNGSKTNKEDISKVNKSELENSILEISESSADSIEKLNSDSNEKEEIDYNNENLLHNLTINLDKNNTSNKLPKDYQFIFKFENNLFFKNKKYYELDELLGDLKGKIINEKLSILKPIHEVIIQYQNILSFIDTIIYEIDIFMSFYKISNKYGCKRPKIISDNSFLIFNGCNILSFLYNDIIPNSFYSSTNNNNEIKKCEYYDKESFHYLNIITSPNSSGKTEFMKMLAMNIYLFQIGMFTKTTLFCLKPKKELLFISDSHESNKKNFASFKNIMEFSSNLKKFDNNVIVKLEII